MLQQDRKIAIFIPSFRGGGAERAMILFAEGLLDCGFEVDFIVAACSGPLKEKLDKRASIIDLNKPKVSLCIFALANYLKKTKPLALYSTIVNANIAALLAKLISRADVPIIVRESNVLTPNGRLTLARKLSASIAPQLYRFAHSVIAVSEDVASELRAKMGSHREKVRVLPTPVVTEQMLQLATEIPDHPWCNEGEAVEKLIIAAGRLHQQKDFTTLIKAIAILRADVNARLIILGEGELRTQLETLVEELGLSDCISLPGFVENPFSFMKCCDVFVLSSAYEGMPNVLLQAMALGTPVVSTDCQRDIVSLVNESHSGEIVPVGDPKAMAEALRAILGNNAISPAPSSINHSYSVQSATSRYLDLAGLGA